MLTHTSFEGILILDKPSGVTSFDLIRVARRRLNISKIGHAGTLDPFATGVVVLLIGRNYTKLADQFLTQDKEYDALIKLGIETDTLDCDGQIINQSSYIPDLPHIEESIRCFQGWIDQVPPMYSAKKIQGKKLYELARKGQVVDRKPQKVHVDLQLLHYEYPQLRALIQCSKGTYIRSIADDLGKKLGCGAHLIGLRRLRSGNFTIQNSITLEQLKDPNFPIQNVILKSLS